MAASSSNSVLTAGESSSNGGSVPQWKKDLIQRRRQQNKVLASNGANVQLCTAVFASSSSNTSSNSNDYPVEEHLSIGGPPLSHQTNPHHNHRQQSDLSSSNSASKTGRDLTRLSSFPSGGNSVATRGPASTDGAPCNTSAAPVSSANFSPQSVACNMRLEADLSLCSDSEDANGLPRPKEIHGKSSTDENTRNELDEKRSGAKTGIGNLEPYPGEDTKSKSSCRMSRRIERDVLVELAPSKSGARAEEQLRKRIPCEDAESDSSEELEYGPGIVNKLKSKYLNLTLREMNKSRVSSVQRFRRAASLENLLDCEENVVALEKNVVRKYAKKNICVTAKTDRYRHASRGNESMKRARSVETLMRYNCSDDVPRVGTNGVRQESTNEQIIFIDRMSVKLENRLIDPDRPKPVNKPKRVKPVLAETERPPADLVKTTMRIFEGSAKKLKPKGEVAVKVATFKTINDSLKAQKKMIIPKPPLQPKPLVNGTARLLQPPSPKKTLLLPQKPTAELIENQEDYHIEGVITEPIVQSVSSVVSKFQQIEKSHSPSPSPEPPYKLRFSPAPSPEPPGKFKSVLEVAVKSPPVTPVLSPRLAPPLTSPGSSKRDSSKQQPGVNQKTCNNDDNEEKRALKIATAVPVEKQQDNSEEKGSRDSVGLTEEEKVDGSCCWSKTIAKSSLDNIGKAGTTMQFSFSDKPVVNKTYLPGLKNSQQRSIDVEGIPLESSERPATNGSRGNGLSSEGSSKDAAAESEELVSRLRERTIESLDEEGKNAGGEEEEAKRSITVPEKKPIGAISSLGLIRPSEGKPSVKSQKTTESPSPPQKQIGIIRPLVSTKTQQSLSSRELEKNLINRVKSIEQPTKVVVSLKSADEIQPVKKASSGNGGVGGGGLWDTKPWNQQNNTMVFNFSNRKDVPDYIENDGLFVRRKRDKAKVGDSGIIVLDATVDASTTDDADWEISGGPPSPCDVSFTNDNILINGRSNLSKQPRNHKCRIQFDDTATRTFEYPSETSMMEGENSSVDGETSVSDEQSPPAGNKTPSTGLPSLLVSLA
ncbi:uncharacterized protein bif isoform X2 [Prorops nasuta]|uniref:uncharacterized protein bif isoform X2 n=1 Tax=Prorops nasuta TaxID=863751 RepID=UPI0034CF6CF4